MTDPLEKAKQLLSRVSGARAVPAESMPSGQLKSPPSDQPPLGLAEYRSRLQEIQTAVVSEEGQAELARQLRACFNDFALLIYLGPSLAYQRNDSTDGRLIADDKDFRVYAETAPIAAKELLMQEEWGDTIATVDLRTDTSAKAATKVPTLIVRWEDPRAVVDACARDYSEAHKQLNACVSFVALLLGAQTARWELVIGCDTVDPMDPSETVTNAEQQFQLGVMFHFGQGVQQNDAMAAHWYQQAADQGQADAECNLGNLYRDGRGVPQDEVKAREWWMRAANHGITLAQTNLGVSLAQGAHSSEDFIEAYKWLSVAMRSAPEENRAAIEMLISALNGLMTEEQLSAARARAASWLHLELFQTTRKDGGN